MKKYIAIIVFCLFSLFSYSQVITVYENSIKYEVENYDSSTFKLDTLQAIIASNPNINYINFFENGAFRKSIESKDIINTDSTTILSKIKGNRPKSKSKPKSKPKRKRRFIILPKSSSYYRDYRTGYTIETHTYSHSGYAVMKDASGRVISTTSMRW